MSPSRTLVLGAGGQLGRALREVYPDAEFTSRDELDIARPDLEAARSWRDYGTIINAAAYTKVDLAETTDGRRDAWAANVTAVAALARLAATNGITLVHVSSDYVFDGATDRHDELEGFAPLGVYGQTKAAGDAIVSLVPRHYTVRTSWVIGDGSNFVRTMASLAEGGINPQVVNDQIGRLSFARDIAAGIRHLVEVGAPFGVYNLTNAGEPLSWTDIAKHVYAAAGHDAGRVTGVSTEVYFAGKLAAPRPLNSVLALDRIRATGFEPRDHLVALDEYLDAL